MLLVLLACTSSADKAEDTSLPEGADTSGDTDTAALPRDEVACDAGLLDPVDAGTVTVDWSARMPLDRVDAMVLDGPAADAQARACAGDLSQAEVRALWTHDPARDGELASGTLELGPYAGTALALRVEDAAGTTGWFVDVEAGGATLLTLEAR